MTYEWNVTIHQPPRQVYKMVATHVSWRERVARVARGSAIVGGTAFVHYAPGQWIGNPDRWEERAECPLFAFGSLDDLLASYGQLLPPYADTCEVWLAETTATLTSPLPAIPHYTGYSGFRRFWREARAGLIAPSVQGRPDKGVLYCFSLRLIDLVDPQRER